MLTIILGLIASSFYSLFNLLSQRLLRRVSWMTITLAIFLTGILVLTMPALLVDGLPQLDTELADLALAALGGLLYTLATGSFLLALRVGKLSLVVVLACLDGAFASVVSIGMGERLSATAAAGLVLAAGGGLLAAVEHGGGDAGGDGRRRWRLAAGAGLALVTAASMAGVFVAYGHVDAFSPFTTVSVASFAGLAVMLPLVIVRRAGLPDRGSAAGVLGASLLDMAAFLAGSAALALGPVSVASVLQAQTATISTVLGLAVLHERPAWWQAVGVAATIVGVTLLAWAM
jgi:drug/metabolite transporter (DMT)-like permease